MLHSSSFSLTSSPIDSPGGLVREKSSIDYEEPGGGEAAGGGV